jgi:hypothetical protein
VVFVNKTVSGAVHGFQRIINVLSRKGKHMLLVVLPVSRSFPELLTIYLLKEIKEMHTQKKRGGTEEEEEIRWG